MRVILNTDIDKLGKLGDIVEVKPGYARNYLFPRDMALKPNKHNLQLMEIRKKKVQKKLEIEKLTAIEQKQKIEEITITFEKKAGETDTLFGSVTPAEIEEKLLEQGVTIERRKLHLEEPIKRLGSYTCTVKLFDDVDAEFKIEVLREGGEEVKEEVKEEEKEVKEEVSEEVKEEVKEEEKEIKEEVKEEVSEEEKEEEAETEQ